MVYVYAPNRKAARPQAHLDGFRGILQVDGYSGYRDGADVGGPGADRADPVLHRLADELMNSGAIVRAGMAGHPGGG